MTFNYVQHDPDDELRDLLGDLKGLEPPPETRQAIRRAVAAEFARVVELNSDGKAPVWRRTIAVPWPVAAACVILLFASWTWIIADYRTVDVVNVQSTNTITTPPLSPPVAVEQRQMTLERRETTTYLCGVGPIYKSTQYFSSEE